MYSEWLQQYSTAKIADAATSAVSASTFNSLQCEEVAPESKRLKQCKLN